MEGFLGGRIEVIWEGEGEDVEIDGEEEEREDD